MYYKQFRVTGPEELVKKHFGNGQIDIPIEKYREGKTERDLKRAAKYISPELNIRRIA